MSPPFNDEAPLGQAWQRQQSVQRFRGVAEFNLPFVAHFNFWPFPIPVPPSEPIVKLPPPPIPTGQIVETTRRARRRRDPWS